MLARGLCLILISSLLFGCSNDSTKKLQAYINTVKSRPAQPIEPIPKFVPPEGFEYAAHDERNPFAPFAETRTNDVSEGPDHDRPKEPLEAYPLDSLKMVGTLHVKNELWALINAPDGMVYKVKIGNYIGQNYGRVNVIQPGIINITEMVKVSGNWEKKPAKISMDVDE